MFGPVYSIQASFFEFHKRVYGLKKQNVAETFSFKNGLVKGYSKQW